MDKQAQLKDLIPEHKFLVCIDSDGCVFNSMEVKHKQFFIPNVISHFRLGPVEDLVRETWEFVNLYSSSRGTNRFPALIKVFDLLVGRPEIFRERIWLPELKLLRKWIDSETRLGNPALRKFCEANNDAELKMVLSWSEAVNADIERNLQPLAPFRHAQDAIIYANTKSDILVVSQTPFEALEKEWNENSLSQYVRCIAGQESGTKSEHIALASNGKYRKENILMIGDAPGDLKAAKDNGVLFFPVLPGKEDESWQKLLSDGFPRFFSGKYDIDYMEALEEEFMERLPDLPPWQRT